MIPRPVLLVACSAVLVLSGCDALQRLFAAPGPGAPPAAGTGNQGGGIPPSPVPLNPQSGPASQAAEDTPPAVGRRAATTAERAQDPLLEHLAEQPLRATRHGECRMDCRHISRAEVQDLLQTGHVNHSRTRHDGRCPSYAVEGQTDDGQNVRIVYADCPGETRIVTAIDLDREWRCNCR